MCKQPQTSKAAFAAFVFENKRGNVQVDVTEQDSIPANTDNKNA